MLLLRIFITVLLSVFSTVVMSYIALAASIGPWIETTLVLISMFLFKIVSYKLSSQEYVHNVGVTTMAGALGGILATGLAFSLPTLYFLSPSLFQAWLQKPFFFAALVSAFCFAAGSFGLLLASLFENQLLVQQKMKFPIGELIYNAIASPGHMRKAVELGAGFFGTQLLLYFYSLSSYAKQALLCVHAMRWSIFSIPSIAIPLDQFPLYIAVGFVTGHVIALPLIAGFLAKVFCLDPLFYLYTHADSWIHSMFFARFANIHSTSHEFILAFCSGMVLYGSVHGFLDLFKSGGNFCREVYKQSKKNLQKVSWYALIAGIQTTAVVISALMLLRYYHFTVVQQCILMSLSGLCIFALLAFVTHTGIVTTWGFFPVVRITSWRTLLVRCIMLPCKFIPAQEIGKTVSLTQLIFVLVTTFSFLYYCNFSFYQQLYLLILTTICIYQMLIIAGRIGIIPLGRFATFVMVPGMFLFNFDYVQITLVAAFVEVAGGVAGDVLFGRRLAQLAKVPHQRIAGYQWLGLVTSCLLIGAVFWMFVYYVGIGPDSNLPATKAASRALLIAFKSFDWYVLLMGFIFGFCIKYTKINPALLLGGILMPPSISLMLIVGGMLTYLTQQKERYYPLLSGVSAGNSIWMLGEILLKIVR